MNGVFARIVVPTDFSPCSKHAWQLAQRLATALGSELILVHVFVEGTLWSESPFNMERVRELFADERSKISETLDEWATQARAAGLTVGIAMRDGIPYHEIVTLAQDRLADLIVIGISGVPSAVR